MCILHGQLLGGASTSVYTTWSTVGGPVLVCILHGQLLTRLSQEECDSGRCFQWLPEHGQ